MAACGGSERMPMRVYRTGASPAKFHEVFPSSSTRHERNDEPYPVNLQEPSQSKVAWLGLLRGRLLRTVCSRGALDGSKVRCRFFLAGAENLPACSCIPNGVLLTEDRRGGGSEWNKYIMKS